MFLLTFNGGNWENRFYVCKTFLSWYQNLNVSKIDLLETFRKSLAIYSKLVCKDMLRLAKTLPHLICLPKMTFILSSLVFKGFFLHVFSVNLSQRCSLALRVCIWHFSFASSVLALPQKNFVSIWIWGLKAQLKCQREEKTKC